MGKRPDHILCCSAAALALSAMRLATETWPATRGGKAGRPMTATHIAKVFEGFRDLVKA